MSHSAKSLRIILIFSLALLIYANSISNPFQYDDLHHIADNPNIRSLKNIPAFFYRPEMFSVDERYRMYRPFLMTSYALNYYMGGNNPWGYHLFNVLLHGINSILLYFILSLLFRGKNPIISVIGAVIYAVHPINSETVNYISARSALMATTFYVLSFYLYIRFSRFTVPVCRTGRHGSRFTYYALSLLSFALALLTKEIAITLPIILLLYDYLLSGRACPAPTSGQTLTTFAEDRVGGGDECRLGGRHNKWHMNNVAAESRGVASTASGDDPVPRNRPQPDPKDSVGQTHRSAPTAYSLLSAVYSRLKLHLPFWVVAVTYFVIRKSLLGAAGIPKVLPAGEAPVGVAGDISRTTVYQLTQIQVLLNYIKIWFLPINLNVNHAYPVINSLWMPSLWIAISILMLIIISFIILLVRKQALPAFFILWFFIAHLPTSFHPLSIVMAENRMYLPGIGLIGFSTVVIKKILEKRQRVSILLLIIILALYSMGTVDRNRVWKDEYSLWSDAALKSPHSWWSLQWLGDVFRRKGEYDMAIKLYLMVLKIDPRNFMGYNALSIAYNAKGLHDKALAALKKAIEINPAFPEGYYNLGNFYLRAKQYEQAVEAYQMAIKLRPHFSEAHNNLGNAYLALGDSEGALHEYKLALESNPTNMDAQRNLDILMQNY